MCTPRISPYFWSRSTFTKPSCMPDDGRFAVADERELADFDIEALLLRLLLRQADAADSGLGVRGAGNAVPIDRDRLPPGHVIESNHSFHRGHMSELRSAGDDVADSIDAGFACLLKPVTFTKPRSSSTLVFSIPHIVGVRLAADRDQQLVELPSLPSYRRERHGQLHTVRRLSDVVGFGSGLDPNSLLLKITSPVPC